MLSAKQAQEMTGKALCDNSKIVLPYIEYIEKKIKTAALEGKKEIHHPFAGLPNREYPTNDVKKAVCKILQINGYTWTDNPNPDPGSPTSYPYTTVSW